MQIKKIVRIVRIAVVISLGLAAHTYAAGLGFYMGAQVGYGKDNTPMLPSSDVSGDVTKVANDSSSNNIFLKSTIATPPVVPSHLKVVAQPITIDPFNNLTSFTSDSHNSLFLGRFFLGYQFKSWLGVEFGFSAFSNTNLSYNAFVTPADFSAAVSSVNNVKLPVTTNANLSGTYGNVYRKDIYSQKAVDLLLRLSVPFFETFDAYAKFGGAFVHTSIDTQIEVGGLKKITVTSTPAFPPLPSTGPYTSPSYFASAPSRSINNVYPEISLGVGYYFNPSISADLSWTSIFVNINQSNGSGSTKTKKTSISQNTNYFALGLSYHFVDRYCGQFLCDSDD